MWCASRWSTRCGRISRISNRARSMLSAGSQHTAFLRERAGMSVSPVGGAMIIVEDLLKVSVGPGELDALRCQQGQAVRVQECLGCIKIIEEQRQSAQRRTGFA